MVNPVIEYIRDEAGGKTKHQQIVDGVVQAISQKKLKSGDMLPSVNLFMEKLQLARMTIVKALEELKERGIIESKNRVGYFVKSGNIKQKLKVMFFLTEFNVYHEVLYNEIVSRIGKDEISSDLYFHHCNPKVFKSILKENLGHYGLYIITPFEHPDVKRMIQKIPGKKVLQIMRPPVVHGTSFISQEFYGQVLKSLLSIRQQISKYNKFILVFPKDSGHPESIKIAFQEFCSSQGIKSDNVNCIKKEWVQENHAFFLITDSDLIDLVKYGEEKGLTLGKNLGVLSYNDTPMKEIIRNGITVISTDFAKMGREVVNFIKTRQHIQKNIDTEIKLRNSL